ncbi:hypothetical protein [Chroococcus sp. FPU101]|uniref:hypothetical protein n=1 Tax=Chroococcus sp. FPU101 TaxID=1974212 RepID=UPI001A90131D|nr:hypothetical protein [Chroococcus sp. FPU101]GFE72320.1 hypothetical protein CFPU101_49300 [Chroococcus sp. FPU101]
MCDNNSYSVKISDLYPGTTFLYRKNSYSISHLYIILTDCEDVNGVLCVVSVNITTQTRIGRGSDTTVILNVGDHPFIKKPSVVNYNDAEFSSVEKLIRYINEEQSLNDDDLEKEVLRKIQQGLLDSDRTPIEILEYCQNKF